MSDDQRFDVTVCRRGAHTPWWAPLGKWFEGVVASIPSHRDTRSGRRNATQVRGVLLVVGVLTVVLWESPWAPAALILCVAALLMPVSVSKRRQWVASLRSNRTGQKRVVRTPGVLEVTGKHVTVTAESERVCRLQRKKLDVSLSDHGLELSAGSKKSDRLVVSDGSRSLDEKRWVTTSESRAIEDVLRS